MKLSSVFSYPSISNSSVPIFISSSTEQTFNALHSQHTHLYLLLCHHLQYITIQYNKRSYMHTILKRETNHDSAKESSLYALRNSLILCWLQNITQVCVRSHRVSEMDVQIIGCETTELCISLVRGVITTGCTRPSLCTAVVCDRRRPSLCCQELWLDLIKGILLLLLLLLLLLWRWWRPTADDT